MGRNVSGKSGSAHTWIGRFVNEPLVKPAAVFKFPSLPYFLFPSPLLLLLLFFFSFAQEVRSQWFTTGITVNVDRVAIYIAGRRNDDPMGPRAEESGPETRPRSNLDEINEKRGTGVNETMAGHVSTNRRRGNNPTPRARSTVRWSLSRWRSARDSSIVGATVDPPYVRPRGQRSEREKRPRGLFMEP